MENFQIIQPSPLLAPYVRHYWLLESDDVDTPQRIIPTGHIELVFHRGSPLMKDSHILQPQTAISGQNIGYADLTPTGRVDMIVVVFHPFGVRAFFDMPVSELSGMSVSADDLGHRELRELGEKIQNSGNNSLCINWIETFLQKQLNPIKAHNYQRMEVTVRAINQSSGELRIAQLANLACLSSKQFCRVFDEHIGASPKDFMRTVRFHKALFTLQNSPLMSLTRLAHQCGYYDQSHMTREFKLFSGYTPGEYLAVCDPYSDYFS